MEKKDIKYRLLRFLTIIILISLIIIVFDGELSRYQKIFWIAPILTAILLIIDDMIKDIENKNSILLKMEHLIFFINWILLSSMLIISMFLDLSTISKITSLICLLGLNYVVYKRYMVNKDENKK